MPYLTHRFFKCGHFISIHTHTYSHEVGVQALLVTYRNSLEKDERDP